MTDKAVIVSAVRTPIGGFLGGLSKLSSAQLGSKVISEALTRSGVRPDEVSEVIMGQVLTAGQGQNPARQAAYHAGLPFSVPAANVGMVCGSGLRAVAMARQAILSGDSSIVVAGGQESMSQCPHAMTLRSSDPVKFGDKTLTDIMIKDGLTDAFNNYHMGVTAENVAEKWNLSREEQDAFAAESQRKTKIALDDGAFVKEIVAVSIPGRRGEVVTVEKDEHPKPETTAEGLAKLRPAFKPGGGGTVTAGNASGLNDGAAAVVVMSAAEASTRGVAPLATIVSVGTAGVDPAIMGTGPVPAVKKALQTAGWAVEDVDVFELNEAFAAQSLAVVKDLGVDPAKVNVNGGAIALGHPIGASGCRILVTLLHILEARGLKKGVASLCIGGGMGIAMCVERN